MLQINNCNTYSQNSIEFIYKILHNKPNQQKKLLKKCDKQETITFILRIKQMEKTKLIKNLKEINLHLNAECMGKSWNIKQEKDRKT